VPYGELIDAARAMTTQTSRPDPARAFIDFMMRSRRARQFAYRMLLAYQRLGLDRLLRASRLPRLVGLERAVSLLPRLKAMPTTRYASPSRAGYPKVALFTGCVAEIFDRETLHASQSLLERLGHNVVIPPGQTCCGALHQHAGEPDKARVLMQRTVEAFETQDFEVVISTASGCGAQLAEYGDRLRSEPAHRLARRHREICQYLAELKWPAELDFMPLHTKVSVHTPCSLSHVLKQPDYAKQLLARVPGLELSELPDNARCCGAAGSYMLTQPHMADELLADKLRHLESKRPEILVTSNIGCALHLQAGVRRAGLAIEVMHPVVLLERQLANG
jgi:glycolate oxidase iron-sulfur subunit